jgi:hypothetical protein
MLRRKRIRCISNNNLRGGTDMGIFDIIAGVFLGAFLLCFWLLERQIRRER